MYNGAALVAEGRGEGPSVWASRALRNLRSAELCVLRMNYTSTAACGAPRGRGLGRSACVALRLVLSAVDGGFEGVAGFAGKLLQEGKLGRGQVSYYHQLSFAGVLLCREGYSITTPRADRWCNIWRPKLWDSMILAVKEAVETRARISCNVLTEDAMLT